MSSKCEIWANYDNDKKAYRFPVNPEEISVSVNGKVTTIDIDNAGTLLHKGKRDAMEVSFESYFPAYFGANFCSCTSSEYKNPAKMHKWMLALMAAKNPFHLVITGGAIDINMYAVITQYQPSEKGGDPGTIWFSFKCKEYRSVEIETIKAKKKSSSGKSSSKKKSSKKKTKKKKSKKRVNNKAKKKVYTVKSGDCLWNIAKKYYGNGAQYTKIYNANKKVIGSNPNVLYPGQKLTIP